MQRTLPLVALCFATSLSAQPVLNSGDLALQPGEVIPFGECPVTGEVLEPETGAGVIWSYQGMNCQPYSSYHYVDPASAPGNSYFPTATVAGHYPGGAIALFHRSTANEEIYLGYGGFYLGHCSDPRIDMQYPFTYESSFTDYMVCEEDDNYYRVRSGTTTYTCVGYGTLHLPQGSYDDVLLVRKQYDYLDDYLELEPGHLVGTDHLFYKAGIHLPLLHLHSSVYSQDGGSIQNTNRTVLMDLTTNTPASPEAPAHAFLLVDSPTSITLVRASNGTADLVLYSVDGRVLHNSRLGASEQRRSIDLSAMASGAYLLRLTDGTNTTVLRGVKE